MTWVFSLSHRRMTLGNFLGTKGGRCDIDPSPKGCQSALKYMPSTIYPMPHGVKMIPILFIFQFSSPCYTAVSIQYEDITTDITEAMQIIYSRNT